MLAASIWLTWDHETLLLSNANAGVADNSNTITRRRDMASLLICRWDRRVLREGVLGNVLRLRGDAPGLNRGRLEKFGRKNGPRFWEDSGTARMVLKMRRDTAPVAVCLAGLGARIVVFGRASDYCRHG
jgi:hypothetical protein